MVKKQELNTREKALEFDKKQLAEDKKAELARLPMNQYMGKGTALGKRMGFLMLSTMFDVQDNQRRIKLFYVMLKDSKAHIARLKADLALVDGEIGARIQDKGESLTIEQARVRVLEEEVRIQGCLQDIRNKITQNLLPLIDVREFNEAVFEAYVEHLERILSIDGYVLFPTEYNMIPLQGE